MLYTCEYLNERGQGVARESDGKVIFADDWLIGELADIEILKTTATYHVGRIVKRLEDHPARVEPPCSVFKRCGGCHLQHLEIHSARAWKVSQLESQLRLFALDARVYPMPDSDSYSYRHKLLLPFRKNKKHLESGFFSAFSNQLVAIASSDEKNDELSMIGCKVQTWALNRLIARIMPLLAQEGIEIPDEQGKWPEAVPTLRYLLARQAYAELQVHVTFVVTSFEGPWQVLAEHLSRALQEEGITLTGAGLIENARGDNRYLEGSWKLLVGSPYLEDRLLGMEFSYDPLSFFQVNPQVAQSMWQQVQKWLSDAKQTRLLELYSGRGLLANWLALQGMEVMGLERDEKAVFQASELARKLFAVSEKNGSGGSAQFQLRDLSKSKESWWDASLEPWEQTVWMVNPPRKGLSRSVREAVASSKQTLLIYMACGQLALMEDACYLKSVGYSLKELRPYDLFSQTCHVETLALFVR